MKRQTIYQLLLVFLCLNVRCDFLKNEIREDAIDILQNIEIRPFRYHYPIRLVLDKDTTDATAYVGHEEGKNFDFTIFELRDKNDCIINLVGTQEFRIFNEAGGTDALMLGIHRDNCPTPSIDEVYKIGIKIEDNRDHSKKEFFPIYKYIRLDSEEQDYHVIELMPKTENGTSKFTSKFFFHEETTINNETFWTDEMNIRIPEGFFFDEENNRIEGDSKYDMNVVFIKNSAVEPIQSNPAFPLPFFAREFLDTNGMVYPEVVGEFIQTSYIGLDIFHNASKKRVTKIGSSNNPIKLTVETGHGLSDTLQVWRFFIENEQYKWQRILTNIQHDNNGKVIFEAPLSLGFAITSQPPIPACADDENIPYATIDITFQTPHNNLGLNQVFTAKLFDKNDNEMLIKPSMYGNTIYIYGVSRKKTRLKLYGLEIDGFTPSSAIPLKTIELDCGDYKQETIPSSSVPPMTSLFIDIGEAFCDTIAVPVAVDRNVEVWALPISQSATMPSTHSPNWIRLGFMQGGKLRTWRLKKGEEYWFKVSALEFSENNNKLQSVFHRPIKIETDGLDPIPNTMSGRLFCEDLGGGNDACRFVIDDSFSLQELYQTGWKYCDIFR